MGIMFDDITKRQTKYMNINLCEKYKYKNNKYYPISNKTDVKALCIGYESMYCGDNNGSLNSITTAMDKCDKYINMWDDKGLQAMLRGTFGKLITTFTFDSVYDRLCVGIADRVGTNNVVWMKLIRNYKQLKSVDRVG